MPRTEAILSAILPILPILVPLGVHFVLVCFVLLFPWLSLTYFLSHLVLFLVGLWACHDSTSVVSAITVVVVVLFTVLLDIIQLGLLFPSFQAANGGGNSQGSRTWQFSAGMCIINLLLKPVSILLCCVAVYIRTGGAVPGLLAGNRENAYTTIHGESAGNEN